MVVSENVVSSSVQPSDKKLGYILLNPLLFLHIAVIVEQVAPIPALKNISFGFNER